MRATPLFSLIMFLAVVLGCAGVLLAQPRSAVPTDLPSLVLPAQPVAEQLAEDARAAKRAPATPLAKQLDTLLLELGHAEQEGGHTQHERVARGKRMAMLFAELLTESGQAGVAALRAQATQRLMTALDTKLAPALARDVIGGFSLMLEREGCSRAGELVAPLFVVRTLYKARWNLMHREAPTASFSKIEQRAFYGWQALHGERLPLVQRLEALKRYAEVGGTDVPEAAAVLLYRSGELAAAIPPFEAAYRKSGNLRLRNHMRALQ